MARRGYDAAGKGRRQDGWFGGSASANAVLGGSLATIRDRARDLRRNNPYADRAIRVIASNTVGKGITPHARDRADPKNQALWESHWIEWGDSTQCDADGVQTFYGLQNLIMQGIAESGEVLVIKQRLGSKSGQRVPLQLQVIEPDYLDTTKDAVNADGSRIVQGIEFNAKGKRVAYHLFNEHPGDLIRLSGLQSRRVDASEVLHVYRIDRPGQVRGVAWGATVLLRLLELGDYEGAELFRQKIASCYVGVIHDSQDSDGDEDASAEKDADGNKIERFTPGTFETLPPGKEITFGVPPTTNAYSPHSMAMLRSIAIGYGVSYEALTGHLGEVNFSSGRMGWLEFQRNIDQWQEHLLIPNLCLPVWRWFVEATMLAGLASKPCAALWTPPEREMIDPVKETEAKVLQVRAGFKSRSDVIRSSGKDPADVIAEISKDKVEADKLGLKFETDPAHDVKPTRFGDE